jgi:hypothetical protein
MLGSAVASVVFVLFSARTSSAEDFALPHRFSPGDLLSADQLNEQFEELELANRSVNDWDLYGRWSCDAYHSEGYAPLATPEWTIEPVAEGLGLIKLNGVEITFSDDGGESTFTTSAPDPFWPSRPDALTSSYRVIGDVLFYRAMLASSESDEPFLNSMVVKRHGRNRFVLHNTCGMGCQSTGMLVCDRADVPPPAPQALVGSLSGADVVLGWSYSGSEEDSFRILRKATLQDRFETLAETDAGAITYTDQPERPGTYWYRVIALGEFGESLGSNEVKVTLE